VWCPPNNWTTHCLAFLRRGSVQPGWIRSSVCRQRESLVTIDSTVAVQTKGFWFSFQAPPSMTSAALISARAALNAVLRFFTASAISARSISSADRALPAFPRFPPVGGVAWAAKSLAALSAFAQPWRARKLPSCSTIFSDAVPSFAASARVYHLIAARDRRLRPRRGRNLPQLHRYRPTPLRTSPRDAESWSVAHSF
jgi:hypothetical protein